VVGGAAGDVSHRFLKRPVVNALDEVDNVAALTTSIANPAAGPASVESKVNRLSTAVLNSV
jgi:hypothetical protein